MLRLRVEKITPLTDRVSEFVLGAEGEAPLPEWQPGAHVDVDLGALGTRSYSLIRFPGENDRRRYRIAVQREDDGQGGSLAMHALREGAGITASLPKNDFMLADGPEPVTLLAGGIGVTPLISMASALAESGRPFTFHYAGRSAGVMAWLERLGALFGPALAPHFDDRTPIDLQAVAAAARDHALYICGPKGMIDATRAAAEAAGIPPERIHVELFTTPASSSGDTAFEVELASDGRVIPVAPGQSIIEALEQAGVDLIYDCQRGDCGICQTGVISGIPDHRDVVLSEAERASGKVMQICVSRAKSPRLVLDI